MLDYLVVLYQLYQKPNIDFQAAVQQALAGPKVAAVSGVEPIAPLEQRLTEKSRQDRKYTLGEVKDLLSKPYLDPKNSPAAAYSDLILRGAAIKYALTNYSAEDMGLAMRVSIDNYLLRTSHFGLVGVNQDLGLIHQQFQLMHQDFGQIKNNLSHTERDIDWMTEVFSHYSEIAAGTYKMPKDNNKYEVPRRDKGREKAEREIKKAESRGSTVGDQMYQNLRLVTKEIDDLMQTKFR